MPKLWFGNGMPGISRQVLPPTSNQGPLLFSGHGPGLPGPLERTCCGMEQAACHAPQGLNICCTAMAKYIVTSSSTYTLYIPVTSHALQSSTPKVHTPGATWACDNTASCNAESRLKNWATFSSSHIYILCSLFYPFMFHLFFRRLHFCLVFAKSSVHPEVCWVHVSQRYGYAPPGTQIG